MFARFVRRGENIYPAVRDCFKDAASDYEASSQAARWFYARIRDRFLFAATGKTAAQILLERADGTKPNMGVSAVFRCPQSMGFGCPICSLGLPILERLCSGVTSA